MIEPVSTHRPSQKLFQVGNLDITAQFWSNGNCRNYPAIALHGWMDNSASFQPMAEKLTSIDLLALDLAGHGTSSWRSNDSSYNLWQDVAEVLSIADQQGWHQFSVVGHSRGAMISLLLAAVAPERVSKLILIDGFVPIPVKEEDAPEQLRKAIADKQRLTDLKRRQVNSIDHLVKSRVRGNMPMSFKAAELIVRRGSMSCEEGFYWSADPRLQGASEVKFSDGQLKAFAKAVRAPVQLYLATQGMGKTFDKYKPTWELVRNSELIEIAGGHHCHMEQASQNMADRIERFIGL